MRISFELKVFLVIILSTSLIFSFSILGPQALAGILNKTYSDNTLVGSVNISGMDKDEASTLLNDRINDWKTNGKITLSYNQVEVPFSLEEFMFLVDDSLQNVIAGTNNELVINMDESVIKQTLLALSPSLTEEFIDHQSLKNELFGRARLLQSEETTILVENFRTNPPLVEEIIHSITIPIQDASLSNISASVVFEPKLSFSLLSFLEKQGFDNLDAKSLAIMSSAIYQAILPTNFEIVERHISAVLPEEIKLGYEAKIDLKEGLDLVFYNPSLDRYRLEIYSDGELLVVDMVGVPFSHKFIVKEKGFEEYAPKTIKQYSPLLKPGQSTITRNGQKGLYVEISRVFKDYIQLISKDYYPPIHQIQVFGLTGATNSSIPSGEEVTDSNEASVFNEEQEAIDVNESNEDATTPVSDELWGKADETVK